MKARSTLDQAVLKYTFEYGENPECGYWAVNPYKDKCTSVCTGYDSNGNCTGSMCKEDGSTLPYDYFGNFNGCGGLYNHFKKAMNVVKVCDSNAYSNGCIPEYEGNDTIYKSKNDGVSDIDANKATAGCRGWRKEKIKTDKAFVTADGMIFFPYNNFSAPIMAVDVNGQAGPNKWGYDVNSFVLKMSDFTSQPYWDAGSVCNVVDKGGVTAGELLYGKNYM